MKPTNQHAMRHHAPHASTRPTRPAAAVQPKESPLFCMRLRYDHTHVTSTNTNLSHSIMAVETVQLLRKNNNNNNNKTTTTTTTTTTHSSDLLRRDLKIHHVFALHDQIEGQWLTENSHLLTARAQMGIRSFVGTCVRRDGRRTSTLTC